MRLPDLLCTIESPAHKELVQQLRRSRVARESRAARGALRKLLNCVEPTGSRYAAVNPSFGIPLTIWRSDGPRPIPLQRRSTPRSKMRPLPTPPPILQSPGEATRNTGARPPQIRARMLGFVALALVEARAKRPIDGGGETAGAVVSQLRDFASDLRAPRACRRPLPTTARHPCAP